MPRRAAVVVTSESLLAGKARETPADMCTPQRRLILDPSTDNRGLEILKV